jgi:hypothetical protein
MYDFYQPEESVMMLISSPLLLLRQHVSCCYNNNKVLGRAFQSRMPYSGYSCLLSYRPLTMGSSGRYSALKRVLAPANGAGNATAPNNTVCVVNRDFCYYKTTQQHYDQAKYFSSASKSNEQNIFSSSASSSGKWRNKKQSKTFGDLVSPRTDILSNEPFEKALDVFPGSYTNAEFVTEVRNILEDEGYDLDKMLLATSFCSDELNRSLEISLTNQFNMFFNMGGLAGFPFGGVTSFGAMAAHIPEGGSCLIVHGSHVGIDSQGRLGTVERRGRLNGGDCCGSGVAASKYVSSVWKGDMEESSVPKDAIDVQQYHVCKMLLPFAKQLEESENKMLELPRALYSGQTDMMKKIIDKSASAVAGDGTIALIGGIQINTPPEYTDYFLPMDFNIYDNKGRLLKTLWREDDEA